MNTVERGGGKIRTNFSSVSFLPVKRQPTPSLQPKAQTASSQNAFLQNTEMRVQISVPIACLWSKVCKQNTASSPPCSLSLPAYFNDINAWKKSYTDELRVRVAGCLNVTSCPKTGQIQ